MHQILQLQIANKEPPFLDDYQNATLPKSGNSSPKRPTGPTSCATLEVTKADIRHYTLIVQGFENMTTILRQSNTQDEHDPSFVEMIKERST
ncbi:hypothetical protein TNCV_1208461 [Trichonephila clavipes]|nr:hypothetical protein TNCV_1208461 [Trichonephila clavipes]